MLIKTGHVQFDPFVFGHNKLHGRRGHIQPARHSLPTPGQMHCFTKHLYIKCDMPTATDNPFLILFLPTAASCASVAVPDKSPPILFVEWQFRLLLPNLHFPFFHSCLRESLLIQISDNAIKTRVRSRDVTVICEPQHCGNSTY